jgi:hypothetical protein
VGDLTTFELRILSVVEEVVAPLVSSGRATLAVSSGNEHIGAIFAVRPTHADACPLNVRCEEPGFVTLIVGPHHLPWEWWEKTAWAKGDYAALAAPLRECIDAVVAGRYEESVRLTPDGTTGKGRGTLWLARGPMRLRYSFLETLFKRGPWQHKRYEPY